MGIFDKLGKMLGGSKGGDTSAAPQESVMTEDISVDPSATPDASSIPPLQNQEAEEDIAKREEQAKVAAQQLEKDLASGDKDMSKTIEDIGGEMKQ